MSAKYGKIKKVAASDVPNWARHPRKWGDLIDAVLALKPGEGLQVEFYSEEEARRARNAVRKAVHTTLQKPVLRTRQVAHDDSEIVDVFFARVDEENG